MRRIYLSPSNQPANMYAVGGTNEKVQLEAIMAMVQNGLKPFQVETVMATLSYSIGQRDNEAEEKGCTDYLAGHSNAGGGGKGSGAVAFYHPDHPDTKALAISLVEELNAICPYPENRNSQVNNGMAPYEGYGLGEIRMPEKEGVKPVLLEVNFHDNPVTARWIIDTKPGIAAAIVRAIVKAYKLQPIAKPTPTPTPVPVAPPEVKALTGRVKVIYDGKDGLNARKTPMLADNVSHVVYAGSLFTVTGISMDGNFYRLKSGLYISTNEKYVAFTPDPVFIPYLVRITADVLNIRKGPGADNLDVGDVFKGEAYTIVNEQDGWGLLKSGAGWISLNFTEKV